MKQILLFIILVCFTACDSGKGIPNDTLFKASIFPHYKHLPDGKPGREILIQYQGAAFQEAQLDIRTSKNKKVLQMTCGAHDLDSLCFLLPDGIAVTQNEVIDIHLTVNQVKQTQSLTVPAQRQWTVYIYPIHRVNG